MRKDVKKNNNKKKKDEKRTRIKRKENKEERKRGGRREYKKEEKKRIRVCNVVLCLLRVYCTNFIRRFPLLHSFSKAGDSFVLAGEGVTKMHPYPYVIFLNLNSRNRTPLISYPFRQL